MTQREASIAALLKEAEAGGPGAALAARRAAWLSEASDPATARQALALAARLEPLDAAPRLGLARLHAEAGDLADARREAEAVFKEAVDKAARARAAFILGELARAEDDRDAARAAYKAVLEIEDDLLKADRMNPQAARWYARARGRLAELDAADGERTRAKTGAEGALSMLKAVAAQMSESPALAADIADGEMQLGALELDEGQAAPARRRFAQAIARYEALILTEPREPHWRAVLADCWALAAEADYVRGAPKEARDGMERALALRVKLARDDPRERWALAGAWRVRAALLAALNDAPTAATSLAQARALGEQFCSEMRGAEAPARFLLHTMLDQADHALRSGKLNVANEAANAARRVAEAFAKAPEASSDWFNDLAACWDRHGEIARTAGAATEDAFARAVEFHRLAAERGGASDEKHMRALSAALMKCGDSSLAARNVKSTRAAYAESVDLRLRLAEAAPGDALPAYDLAVALERLGIAAAADRDPVAARAAWETELELAERLFEDRSSAEGQRFRAIVESHLASLGGVDAAVLRAAALARFDTLARLGALTERDAALRKKLWSV